MISEPAAQIFVPKESLNSISVPAVAITDGSTGPDWLDVPSIGRNRYSRTPTLRIPYDAAASRTVREWLKFRRQDRRYFTPIFVALVVAGLVVRFSTDQPGDATYITTLALWVIGFLVLWTSQRRLGRVTIQQIPVYTRDAGVRIDGVPTRVAQEWVKLNPEARISAPTKH